MKEINEYLKKENIDISLDKNFEEALQDINFLKLVSSLKINKKLGKKYTSKLQNTVEELKNCSGCKSINECKNSIEGCVNYPKKEEESITFSYKACKYKKEISNNEDNFVCYEVPGTLKEAKMSEIIKEKERISIIKYMKEFLDKFDNNEYAKGMYISGSFGSGKSYLVSALFNELSRKGNKAIIVYYPTLLKNIKDTFNTYEDDNLDLILNSKLLLLDDIGAENNTAWSRDEILGSIVQHRMDNKLPTFFTSNLTIDELEKHLSMANNSVDKVKAKRITERIKQLSNEFVLISENKRK